MNCITKLCPKKWDKLLKVSGSMTAVMLLVKCCAKNKTRNKPESAIATLRAIEEDNIAIRILFQK